MMEEDKYTKALNVQIVVDYGQVELMSEKFEELYSIMKEKAFGSNKSNEKVII